MSPGDKGLKKQFSATQALGIINNRHNDLTDFRWFWKYYYAHDIDTSGRGIQLEVLWFSSRACVRFHFPLPSFSTHCPTYLRSSSRIFISLVLHASF